MPFKKISLIFSIILFGTSAQASQLCGEARQGEILVGKTTPETQIIFNADNKILSDKDGIFLLALGRDENLNSEITFIQNNTSSASHKLDIAYGNWDIQNIKGVPPRKVTPSDSDMRDIELEQKLLRAALATKEPTPYWKKGFIQPVEGRISGKFGGQRIMNDIKRNPHAGTDIAAKEGTPIKASSDGIVVLAAPDLFYSGNVVVIDHGYGLHTIYAHLKEIHVNRGDEIKQGTIIGLVGQTGRATGPHLHWGASLNGIKFRPASLLNVNNNHDFCFTL